VNQSYLPKRYCWNASSIQCATAIRDTIIVPYLAHVLASGVVAYSGFRRHDVTPHSDHLCGFALDLVPKAGATTTGYWQLRAAQAYAKLKRYPYTEFVWESGNHHLHVSFRRCG
jgi:hypothetical protein